MLTLTNCSAPGTALIGPIFTGATTKSVARASLSFSHLSISSFVIENLDFKSKPKEFFHFYR